MSDYDRRKALGAAIEALDAGSRELMLRFRQAGGPLKSWDKTQGAPVTEADLASDRAISGVLSGSGIGTGILSEESEAGEKRGLVWLVDPLCGTFPYREGLAHWGLNVALRDEEILVLGAIALPPTRDVFSAVRGAGAAHNGRRFEPKPPAVPLERSMICVEIDSADEWAAHAPLLTRFAAGRWRHKHVRIDHLPDRGATPGQALSARRPQGRADARRGRRRHRD